MRRILNFNILCTYNYVWIQIKVLISTNIYFYELLRQRKFCISRLSGHSVSKYSTFVWVKLVERELTGTKKNKLNYCSYKVVLWPISASRACLNKVQTINYVQLWKDKSTDILLAYKIKLTVLIVVLLN